MNGEYFYEPCNKVTLMTTEMWTFEFFRRLWVEFGSSTFGAIVQCITIRQFMSFRPHLQDFKNQAQ